MRKVKEQMHPRNKKTFSNVTNIIISTLPLWMMNGTKALAAERPNVIIFLSDDQGYQDVGCFGSPLIKTPNFDQMAKEGMRFTDFYSASPVCSPSRAALLTGCYPPRVGIPRVLFPDDKIGLDSKEMTIADLLKDQGYATACIGKWHLGDQPDFLPDKQGFDSYMGIPYSNDMKINQKFGFAKDILLREGMTVEGIRTKIPVAGKVPLMRDGKVVEYPVDQTTLTKRYTREAISFIHRNKNVPFFLYLAHTMPHIPLHASQDFEGKSPRGLYGDVIEELDWSMGEILTTLKSLGIDDHTLVIFTSDNGPWDLPDGMGGSAYPLRGFKFGTYEGGMREPMIARWPGKIPAGTVCSEIASTIDFLPTIAWLTNRSKTLPAVDGENIWPLLSGKRGAKSHRNGYYYYNGMTLQAVRNGEWKVRIVKDKVELFNLAKDISEKNNLASENPRVVKWLTKKLTDFDKDLKHNIHKH